MYFAMLIIVAILIIYVCYLSYNNPPIIEGADLSVCQDVKIATNALSNITDRLGDISINFDTLTKISPRASSGYIPLADQQMGLINNINTTTVEGFKLMDECSGGCEADDWCKSGLSCWFTDVSLGQDLPVPTCKDSKGNIPGLTSYAIGKIQYNGYCINTSTYANIKMGFDTSWDYGIPSNRRATIVDISSDPYNKLSHCQGNCESDNQCGPGLVCFQQTGNTGIPGCRDKDLVSPGLPTRAKIPDGSEITTGPNTNYCIYEDQAGAQTNGWSDLSNGQVNNADNLCNLSDQCDPCTQSKTGLGINRSCTRTWSMPDTIDGSYCTIYDASNNNRVPVLVKSGEPVKRIITLPCSSDNIITIQNPVVKPNSNEYGHVENTKLINLIKASTSNINTLIKDDNVNNKIADFKKSLNKRIGTSAKNIHYIPSSSGTSYTNFVPLFLQNNLVDEMDNLPADNGIPTQNNGIPINDRIMFKCNGNTGPECYKSNWEL